MTALECVMTPMIKSNKVNVVVVVVVDDVKERGFANCHSLILYQNKWQHLKSHPAVS